MSRVVGTEIEFGILAPEAPEMSPMVTSTQVVLAYAGVAGVASQRRTKWDYLPESPLRDSRGFDLGGARPAPDVEADAYGMATVVLPNGARFYVDHAHPEYSSPEVTDALDAVVWDKAGERIAEQAAAASGSVPGQPSLQLYKNNVDGKGASYGTHENYLIRRDLDFDLFTQGLTPFFATRHVFCGAGRVGLGQNGQDPGGATGFQISQRSDYIECEIGLETTLRRGIMNTRDEPHADASRWRRLHVILGDATMAELATYLKIGTTMLVLDAIEAGVDFSDLRLVDPVASLHRVSRDLTCTEELPLADGRFLTAVEIQRAYLERCGDVVEHTDRNRHLLQSWARILDMLAEDPLSTAHLLDWTAKFKLLRAFKERGDMEWTDPRLALIDLQYSDVRQDKGLYHRLVARGDMKRLVTEEQVRHAIGHPPESTRAWTRGQLIRRFGDGVRAAGWDSLVVEDAERGPVRLRFADPLGFTRATVEPILHRHHEDLAGLFAELEELSIAARTSAGSTPQTDCTTTPGFPGSRQRGV